MIKATHSLSFFKKRYIMTEKKYCLYPGWVQSENDSDLHYITAPKLAKLYGVPFVECIVIHPTDLNKSNQGLIVLVPRRDGKYKEWLDAYTKRRLAEVSAD